MYFSPGLKPVTPGGTIADAAVGFTYCILPGLTGLARILVTIWTGLRGWTKESQRAVFQPVVLAIFLMSALWLGAKGTLTSETARLFVPGLPRHIVGDGLVSSCSETSTKPRSARSLSRCFSYQALRWFSDRQG
jgi:uncharacterized protein